MRGHDAGRWRVEGWFASTTRQTASCGGRVAVEAGGQGERHAAAVGIGHGGGDRGFLRRGLRPAAGLDQLDADRVGAGPEFQQNPPGRHRGHAVEVEPLLAVEPQGGAAVAGESEAVDARLAREQAPLEDREVVRVPAGDRVSGTPIASRTSTPSASGSRSVLAAGSRRPPARRGRETRRAGSRRPRRPARPRAGPAPRRAAGCGAASRRAAANPADWGSGSSWRRCSGRVALRLRASSHLPDAPEQKPGSRLARCAVEWCVQTHPAIGESAPVGCISTHHDGEAGSVAPGLERPRRAPRPPPRRASLGARAHGSGRVRRLARVRPARGSRPMASGIAAARRRASSTPSVSVVVEDLVRHRALHVEEGLAVAEREALLRLRAVVDVRGRVVPAPGGVDALDVGVPAEVRDARS